MEQLPFPFLPWDECEPTTPPWRYRFTKNALIENLGRYRFVFGLWDRLQGCWEVDTETRTFREVTPLWMPLNARGVWSLERQSPPSGLDNRKIPRSPQWRYHTNAAFAGYFSLIPSRIRAIVAHLGCYQWLALDLIAQVPSFASFLDNEIFEGRMQYVMACLALARADQFPRRNRKRLAELIMTRKRRDLLQNLMRTPNPASAVRCLYKLGERAYPPDDYRALLMAMRFSEGRKVLSHATSIKPGGLRLWVVLHPELRTSNLLRVLINEPHAANDVIAVLKLTWRRDDLKAWLANELTKVADETDVLACRLAIEEQLDLASRFPKPPIPGTTFLKPVDSPTAMRREAKIMKNCLADEIEEVLDGDVYFYRWDDREKATVMIEKGASGNWFFGEALGRENADLDRPTHERIRLCVSRQLAVVSLPTESHGPQTPVGDPAQLKFRTSLEGVAFNENRRTSHEQSIDKPTA